MKDAFNMIECDADLTGFTGTAKLHLVADASMDGIARAQKRVFEMLPATYVVFVTGTLLAGLPLRRDVDRLFGLGVITDQVKQCVAFCVGQDTYTIRSSPVPFVGMLGNDPSRSPIVTPS